jgi:intracellular septation protein A
MDSSVISSWGARKRTAAKVGAKAIPGLILGGIIPGVCFLVGRHEWGLAGGVVLVLLWSGAYQAVRWMKTRTISGLIVLYILVLLLRGAVALALNSAAMFFIAPSVVTALGGCVFIASALLAKPLVAPVVNELVPKTVVDFKDPRARLAMIKISFIYGIEQLINAAVLIILALKLSTTMYVAVHGVISWVIMGLVILAGIPFVWKDLRAVVHWDHSTDQPEPAAGGVPESLAMDTTALEPAATPVISRAGTDSSTVALNGIIPLTD